MLKKEKLLVLSNVECELVGGGGSCDCNCECAYHKKPGSTPWKVPSEGICVTICCTGINDQYYNWANVKKECKSK
jgi:hypothetical protein